MTWVRAGLPAASLAFVACAAQESVPALFVPDSIDVHWNDAWNEDDDGLAMLVPVDVMVYEAATGASISDLVVSLDGVHDDATDVEILAVDEVQWLTSTDDPGLPDTWWDARRDAFFELSDEPAGAVSTDAEGVARFYLLVDSLPIDAGAGTPVSATLGDTQETFLLVPR